MQDEKDKVQTGNTTSVLFIIDYAAKTHVEHILAWLRDAEPCWPPQPQYDDSLLVFLPLNSKRISRQAKQQVNAAALSSAEPATLLVPLHALPAITDTGKQESTTYLRSKAQRFVSNLGLLKQASHWDATERIELVGDSATLATLADEFERQSSAGSGADTLNSYIAAKARLALDIAERKLRGRRYKVPRQVAQKLKLRPALRDAIDAMASKTGTSAEKLWQRANKIMDELVAEPNPAWLDLLAAFTKKMLSMGYEQELATRPEDIDLISRTVDKHPTAFLWTHKSYLDGMVVPHVLYQHDLPPAHTFGGLNMAFTGMGSSGRRGGIIFIRRTFNDDELYKLILRHYIAYLLENRFPFSWAFEGTRSRTGKLVPPKYGLLKYLLDACAASNTKDLHILPIAINYDLLGEVADHAREQAGMKKTAESLGWFVKYYRKLRTPMGRIFMDVGQPIVLREPIESDDFDAVAKVAFQVGVEANRVSPVTVPSLVALVLLGAAPRALSGENLSRSILPLLDWLSARKTPMSSDFDISAPEHGNAILKIMLNTGLVSLYEEEPVRLYSIKPEQQHAAAYYRNTIAHHFLHKAFTELALISAENAQDQPLDAFWQEIDLLRDLFKFEFFYTPKDTFAEHIRQELELSVSDWETSLSNGSSNARELFKASAPFVAQGTLRQFVEAYWVGASVLCKAPANETIEKKAFVSK
ncbi:MAG: glycerol-3-phosphate acyltransferase, partial [Pseudomonadales bacterium]|nr:glycerol-3-phosphate acyltransferase [Pseudomonadales bacterium]